MNGKLAQVVKIAGDDITLQVFEGTEGIPTNAEVVFLGKSPTLKVSEQLAGPFLMLSAIRLTVVTDRRRRSGNRRPVRSRFVINSRRN